MGKTLEALANIHRYFCSTDKLVRSSVMLRSAAMVLTFCAFANAAESFSGLVVGIMEGHTIKVMMDGVPVSVRLDRSIMDWRNNRAMVLSPVNSRRGK